MTDLAALTSAQVDALAPGLMLVIPVGSTEQHGPHLPLTTDTDVAVELCRRLAATRRDVVIAPALPYGASGEHAGFAGTLSIGSAALEQVVVELVRSATDSFDHVLIVSGHGGNAGAIGRAVEALVGESRDVRQFSPRWDGDLHAGRTETAMMLAIDPATVDLDVAAIGNVRPLSEIWTAMRAHGVRAVSANGVLGDPRGASAVEGAELLDRLAGQLLADVAAWRGVTVEALA